MAESAQSIVKLPGVVSVKELAEAIEKPIPAVMGELMKNGVMATINEDIDYETAAIIAGDLGVAVDRLPDETEAVDTSRKPTEGSPRPPIVAVLGHVDHGKTSLLDAIQQTDVVGGESGGITQHIGAYQVEATPKGGGDKRTVTFLDTPGHEAFTAMRAHGTKMTDVAILVIAADDGVKPQTKEAVEHIKAAGVPFVVAITKVDVEGADPNKAKQGLAELEVVAEDWGGDAVFVETSSKTGKGIPELLEMVLLVSDIAKPVGDSNGPLSGVVIESRLSRAKGPVATILVQNGTLRVGDYLVIEDVTGRVRLMEDWRGRRLEAAGPGTPVQVAGLSAAPSFGAGVTGAESEQEAKKQASANKRRRNARRVEKPALSMEAIKRAVDAGKVTQLPVVLVADVKGSLEAIEGSLAKIPQDEVAIQLVHAGIGSITESVIRQAESSKAMIVGFKARVEPAAKKLAQQLDIRISTYDVIYELLDDLKSALEALLPPEVIVNEVGKGTVLAIFRTTKESQIIGCKVEDGKFVPGTEYRVDGVETEGKVKTLRRVDEEVQEVSAGTECGLTIVGPRVEEGQRITLLRRLERERKLP
ncbi:MAG: translation initiation factor IF-2 [bacterium]|nr:translation initiation factor IF-2 [bacterium]